MKVLKEAKVVVKRIDGVDDNPKGTGNDRFYTFDGMGMGLDELVGHEKKMVVGLKPGQKRTVHLVMTWEDE